MTDPNISQLKPPPPTFPTLAEAHKIIKSLTHDTFIQHTFLMFVKDPRSFMTAAVVPGAKFGKPYGTWHHCTVPDTIVPYLTPLYRTWHHCTVPDARLQLLPDRQPLFRHPRLPDALHERAEVVEDGHIGQLAQEVGHVVVALGEVHVHVHVSLDRQRYVAAWGRQHGVINK